MAELDYADALRENIYIEIMSVAFGFNCNLSIEVSTCEYHDKYRNDVSSKENGSMEFHSHF